MSALAPRAYVPAYGRDDAAIRKALVWTREKAQAGSGRATVVIPTWRELDAFVSFFPLESRDAITRNRGFSTGSVEFKITTFSTRDLEAVPTLVLWADADRLFQLDDEGLPAICVVPWGKDDIAKWVSAWGPTNLRDQEPSVAAAVGDPVVAAALASLNARVSSDRGLDHPSDKDAAVGMLRLLKKGGHDFHPDQLRAWCMQHGWGSRAAEQLADWASRVLEGGRIKTRDSGWREDVLEIWRGKAAGK